MNLEIVKSDILTMSANVVLLPIDGEAFGMEGAIARQFDRRFPEVHFLEELESQIDYPVPLGQSRMVDLPEESPFPHAIVLCILHHQEILEIKAKETITANAFRSALVRCTQMKLGHVVSPVLVGGWRLGANSAFSVMLRVLMDYQGDFPQKLTICSLDDVTHFKAQARSLGFE